MLILRHLRTDEHRLLFDVDVGELHMSQLLGSDKGVILHHAGKVEIRVCFTQVLLQLVQHLRRQRLTLLAGLGNGLDFLDGVGREILLLDEECRQRGTPLAIVVASAGICLTIQKYIVEKIADKCRVELIDITYRQQAAGIVFAKDVQPRRVCLAGLVLRHSFNVCLIFFKGILQ